MPTISPPRATCKAATGAPTAIGEHIVDAQKLWADIYNLPDLRTEGSQWDHLFADGEKFRLGDIEGRVIFSPGPYAVLGHLCSRRCGIRP